MLKIIGVGSGSGWKRNFYLDPDPELLKSRSSFRIGNKSVRIHNTAFLAFYQKVALLISLYVRVDLPGSRGPLAPRGSLTPSSTFKHHIHYTAYKKDGDTYFASVVFEE